MRRLILATIALAAFPGPADAGDWLFRRNRGNAPQAAAPPAPPVAVDPRTMPAWAAREMAASPVPLYTPTYGRRPWASALSQANTPAAQMARFQQLGGGAGPMPGYTNGPGYFPMFMPSPTGYYLSNGSLR